MTNCENCQHYTITHNNGYKCRLLLSPNTNCWAFIEKYKKT